jgi:hypothetical protein
MNVIGPKNYGAVKESWFSLSGDKMVEFLRETTGNNNY